MQQLVCTVLLPSKPSKIDPLCVHALIIQVSTSEIIHVALQIRHCVVIAISNLVATFPIEKCTYIGQKNFEHDLHILDINLVR